MLTIIYTEHGDSNADAKSEFIAMNMYNMYKDNNYTHLSSTSSLFTAFRMLVAEGKIPHDEVVFKFNNKILEINPDGQMKKGYPKGFCDAEFDLMLRIVNAQIARKGERNEN